MQKFLKENYLFILMALMLIIFSVISVVVFTAQNDITAFDLACRDFFYNIRGDKGGFMYYLATIISFFGDKIAAVLILLAVAAIYKFDKKSIIFILVVGVSAIFGYGFKLIFDRTRPLAEMQWAVESSPSFPSGHSLTSMAIYGFLAYILASKYQHKALFYSVGSVIIILIGMSRLVLGVHYITDVLAGFSLALVFVFLGIIIDKKVKFRE